MPDRPPPPDPRSAAIVLLGAMLPLLLSLVLKSWVSGSRGGVDAGVGLTGIDLCFGGVCEGAPWSKWKLDGDVSTFAVFSLLLGISSLVVAGIYGGLALKGLAYKLPSPKVALALFAATGFVMVLFSIRVITESPGGMGPGLAMGMGLVGVIGAAVGARRLAAADLRPQASIEPAAPIAAAATPSSCPRCSAALTFVAQYQRWFCERCRQYP
ncbi:MAG: hypothetical protein WKG01_02250 [Kofleriaceae bacterium]